jgi:crotonobetaine/carnitine-CoA ligase
MGAMSHFLWAQEPRSDDRDNPLERAIMLPVLPQWRAFEERFGIKVRTCFGMTEASPPFGTGWDIEDPRSCGRLRAGYAVRIVDEHDFEVPVGEVGELIIRHDEPWTLSQGYFGMPEKTATSWRNGWFHTGDAFRQDKDGNYFFIDRFKDAIRRRGENISSFEVEAHVNTHPDVSESAALAVPSEWSEDEVKIVVVLNNGSELAAKSLASFLTDTMPAFMVPRYIEFVDSLPKTDATLRVKKNELRVDALNAKTWDREKPDNETTP